MFAEASPNRPSSRPSDVLVHPYVANRHPIVLAHQGDSVHAPENTLPAFAMAVQRGTDILETDVHWTSDGEIVISHDGTVDRCSDGHGAISELTLAELKRLDFGYRFSPDGGQTYPFRGKGVTIPTLRELLTAHPTIRVNVDVKPDPPRSLRTLLQLLDDLRAMDRVLIASFHHTVLVQIRSMNRQIATSASPREVAEAMLRSRFVTRQRYDCPYDALQIPLRFYGITVVTDHLVRWAHQQRLKVHVWTIDQPIEMEALLLRGIDGIVSNDVTTARTVVDAHVCHNSGQGVG